MTILIALDLWVNVRVHNFTDLLQIVICKSEEGFKRDLVILECLDEMA